MEVGLKTTAGSRESAFDCRRSVASNTACPVRSMTSACASSHAPGGKRTARTHSLPALAH